MATFGQDLFCFTRPFWLNFFQACRIFWYNVSIELSTIFSTNEQVDVLYSHVTIYFFARINFNRFFSPIFLREKIYNVR